MTNILVVEDESIVAWDIKETLEKLGHQVVDLVVSGAEAIQAATTSRPDLVLMDIRLAGSIDGITAGDEIYGRLKIPVIYLTAHADEHTLERATQTNPFGYIIKPFRSQTLQSTIQVALQRHQLEKSTRLSQSGLANTLNSIGNGIIITDRQGLVTFINPNAQKLTGWTATDAIGVEIDRIFRLIWETDGSAIENPSMRAMRLQQLVKSPARCWLMSKDNTETPIADTATPIYRSDGEVVGSIVVFQDNTEPLSDRMDLWERNQDLEFFQHRLISQLQAQTVEYQQAIACIQVLDLVLKNVPTVDSEIEILQIAIQQLGIVIDADYCWCTLHDAQDGTARIVGEYINKERQINPTSKIGKEIDVLLYQEFYNHLFESESWIDPPSEIMPNIYLDLLPLADQMVICPIMTDLPQTAADRSAQRTDWAIGEVGILTTGKRQWKSFQAYLFTQILSHTVRLFRQTHRQSIGGGASPLEHQEAISLSLEWLNSLQDNFSRSIADVNRDLQIASQILQQQIDSIVDATEHLVVVEHPESLHQELSIKLRFLQAEWQRTFQLINTLIDVRLNGTTFQIQSLSDSQFESWITDIVRKCAQLAVRYRQEIGDRITTNRLPPIMLCAFPMLELIIVELFHNACKYTSPDRLIILEVDVRDRQLQVSIVSVGLKLSARELETIFLPFTNNSDELSLQHGITGLGLALVKQLVPHLGGSIRAISDRDSTSLILTVPMLEGKSS
jgi:PAS domain S-box-containing protein